VGFGGGVLWINPRNMGVRLPEVSDEPGTVSSRLGDGVSEGVEAGLEIHGFGKIP